MSCEYEQFRYEPRPPPEYRPQDWVNLMWRSVSRALHVAIPLIGVLAFGIAICFGFVVRLRGFPVALDVTLGVRSAYDTHAGRFGVALSILGYLVLPTVLSLVLAGMWSWLLGARGSGK